MNNSNSKMTTWYIVFLSGFIGCLYAAAFPQFSMTVGQLSHSSGISTEILLLSDTIKSATIVLGMLVSGFFYKQYGLKRTFLFSTLAFIIPQVLIPHVHSIPLLFVLKGIQGLSSLIYSVFLTLIMKYASSKETGLASALFNGIFFGGSGVLAMLTGFIIDRRGWIVSYHALTVIPAVLSLLWIVTVKDRDPGAVPEDTGDAPAALCGKPSDPRSYGC